MKSKKHKPAPHTKVLRRYPDKMMRPERHVAPDEEESQHDRQYAVKEQRHGVDHQDRSD
jgi:hypothetical protein